MIPLARCGGLLLLVASCLGPQVDDRVRLSGDIKEAGAEIPSGHDDPSIEQQIRDNDGVDGIVTRVSAFSAGQRVWYWDFGDGPELLAPVFVLAERDGDELVPIGHPGIVSTIPGDVGYSPFWLVVMYEITDLYDGEILSSVRALEEAEELGLVGPPLEQDFAVNCPVTARGVTVDVGAGDPVAPTSFFYWQGRTVDYFDFGPMPIRSSGLPATAAHVRLARQGEPPLSEPARGVDMTGDEDIADSNDILEFPVGSAEYTPACHRIEVQVPPGYQSIDSSGDETVADFTSLSDLFDPDPVVGNVVAYERVNGLRNCVQQREVGGF